MEEKGEESGEDLTTRKWAGDCETVVFLQATLGELLRQKIQEVADVT